MTAWPQKDLLAVRAATSPSTTAVIDVKDGTATDPENTIPSYRWSYAEFDTLVDDLARRMREIGINAGDHVGAVLDTSVQFVAINYALERLGAVLVPLNVRLTADELTTHCEQADVEILLCNRETESRAVQAAYQTVYWAGEQTTAPRVVSLDDSHTDQTISLWDTAFNPDTELRSPRRSPDDRRMILFTSGTTGSPKAVPLTTGNLIANAIASAFRLGVVQDDRWLCALPMYHMGGLAAVIRSTLYGTSVVLQSEFDAEATPAVAREFEVTGISLVPTMLRRIFDADEQLPESLRFVLLGGAPADDDLISDCKHHDVPVYPTYGMTEAASQITTACPEDAFEHQGTVGRPLFGTDLTIVGPDGEPVSPGDSGEIAVSGPSVTAGYYRDDTASAESFGPHGLYTGDVGYQDETGRLWITNRCGDRIVTGGENVDPVEVATVIRDCPAVRDVSVVGVDDPEWGQRVGALVVPAENQRIGREDIVEQCRGSLARYKHPRIVEFTEALPRTSSGTVDRSDVRERLRHGTADERELL